MPRIFHLQQNKKVWNVTHDQRNREIKILTELQYVCFLGYELYMFLSMLDINLTFSCLKLHASGSYKS